MTGRVLNTLRPALHYRRDAFEDGIRAAGYQVVPVLQDPKPGDALLIWNRYGGHHEAAARFERCGAKVIVVENGYLGKAWRGGEWFSLALWHHAGAGVWPDEGWERWASWGIELSPWVSGGTETLILGQRGIGEPSVRCPDGWAEATQRRIGGRVRSHPGGSVTSIPLAEDLRGVKDVVTWNSGAALIALAIGYPVWCAWPQWIGASAARPLSEFGAEPKRDDAARLAMFQRLAGSIWTLDEIRTGGPLAKLLGAAP